jgi:hypothetical protein
VPFATKKKDEGYDHGTTMTPSSIHHPRPGMLATIPNRRGIIVAVEPFDSQEGRLHLVRVEYTDSDGVAEDMVL